jgi:hypothetical protein
MIIAIKRLSAMAIIPLQFVEIGVLASLVGSCQWASRPVEKPPPPPVHRHTFRRSVQICCLQGVSDRSGDEPVPRESRMFIARVWGVDVRI